MASAIAISCSGLLSDQVTEYSGSRGECLGLLNHTALARLNRVNAEWALRNESAQPVNVGMSRSPE